MASPDIPTFHNYGLLSTADNSIHPSSDYASVREAAVMSFPPCLAPATVDLPCPIHSR